jgi:hypothetical protein
MAPFDEEVELDDGAADADEGVADPEGAIDAEGDAAEEPEAGGAPLAEDALAVAWNAAKLLFAVGFMAKTMPVSQ